MMCVNCHIDIEHGEYCDDCLATQKTHTCQFCKKIYPYHDEGFQWITIVQTVGYISDCEEAEDSIDHLCRPCYELMKMLYIDVIKLMELKS